MRVFKFQGEPVLLLLHGTSETKYREIIESGYLRAPYLTIDESLAEYYGEVTMEEDGADDYTILACLIPLQLALHALMADMNAHGETISYGRPDGMSESDFHDALESGELDYPADIYDYQTSLHNTKSCKLGMPIDAKYLFYYDDLPLDRFTVELSHALPDIQPVGLPNASGSVFLLHGSSQPIGHGSSLLAAKEKNYSFPYDRILESTRPDHAAEDPIFLSATIEDMDACGGITDYIHLVEIPKQSKLTRHDLSWLTEAQILIEAGHSQTSDKVLEMIAGYWSGQPMFAESSAAWEFRADSGKAQIVGRPIDMDESSTFIEKSVSRNLPDALSFIRDSANHPCQAD